MTVTTDAPLIAQSWGWRHSGRKRWAVRDANFTIRPGEKVLLAGASGSGKSTLLAGIAGLLDPEEGTGEGELGTLPGTDLRSLVGMVQQDPDSQVVMGHVGEEIAFGCENWGVPAEEISTRVDEALALVGLDLPLDHPTSQLSGGQKQRLALASALAMRPQILLLDEPTANLDPEGAQMVRESVARIAQVGVTLIVIEHRIEPWLPLVDKMLVMDSGSIVAEGPPETILAEQSARLLAAGVWVPGAPTPSPRPSPSSQASPNPQALVQDGNAIIVRDLSVGYSTPVQEGLNLDIARGISTCITGANGTGKTTLALTLAGLLPPLSGKVELEGHNPHEWSSAELADHVGMVFQEPSYQFLTSSVRAELELSAPGQPDLVNDYLDRLGLSHLAAAHPLTLSGGEKRRLAAATALIRAPKVLILDEPTFGQDRNTWLALVQIVQETAASGTTVVSISHDPDFVAATAQANIQLEVARRDPAGQGAPGEQGGPGGQGNPGEQRATSAAPTAALRKASVLDRVNPVTQILGLALMTVPLMFTIDWVSAAVALALELFLCVILFGSESKKVLRRCWPIFVGAPLAVFSMLLYAAEGGTVYWAWGPASISANSVTLALGMGLRVLAVGIPAVVILSGLDATKTADALTQIARLPSRPVLATLAAARLVSLMLADWDALTRARRIRGVPERSRVTTFFITTFALFSFALRRAGLLSITMEARGFGSETVRSQARTSTLSKADVVMLLVSIVVPACALGTAVAMGTFRWFGL